MDFQLSDLLTIALLVVLEGLLSADNALVLAICSRAAAAPSSEGAALRHPRRVRLPHPRDAARRPPAPAGLGQAHRRALPAVPRVAALLRPAAAAEERRAIKPATAVAGAVSAFWATVVKVELTDIVFAVDSILVAVAMSPKTWVIITGGVLGIIAMRMVIGQLLTIVRRYPALVDGAFIIIAWVGMKLLIEYLHAIGVRPLRDQQVVVVRADRGDLRRRVPLRAQQGPVEDADEDDEARRRLLRGVSWRLRAMRDGSRC